MNMPAGSDERAAARRALSAEVRQSAVLLCWTVGLMGLVAAALWLLTTRLAG